MIVEIIPLQFPSISFPIHYLLIDLPHTAVLPELWAALLN